MTLASMPVVGQEPLANTLERILKAGVIAGLIDAAYFSGMAMLHGQSPSGVLQSIAGFWLGPLTKSLGALSACLGLVTHFAVATIMAAGFMLVPGRLNARRTYLVGAVYGALLYVVMYLVVLPLRWPNLFPRFDGPTSLADIGIHVVIGMAIAHVMAGPTPRPGRA